LLKAVHISDDRREEWDSFLVEQPYFALLQSWEWGELKKRLGSIVYRIAVEQEDQIVACAQLLIKQLPGRLISLAYVPRGPLCDWSDTETTSILLNALHTVAKSHKVTCLAIEPPLLAGQDVDQQIRQYGFRPNRFANQPRATIIVDIAPSEDDILMHMRKKTRQYIHSAVREGIIVRYGNEEDFPAFYELIRLTGQREHFPIRSLEYYKREWEVLSKEGVIILLMAFYREQLVAVRTAYRFGAHAAEFYAGSLNLSTNLHPNYLLVWEAIQWAKSKGCRTYDLWGIPGEISDLYSPGNEPPVFERSDGLWGVYRFKCGFSKNIVSYIGAYDYVYQPVVYPLIANRFVRGEALDRITAWMDSISSK